MTTITVTARRKGDPPTYVEGRLLHLVRVGLLNFLSNPLLPPFLPSSLPPAPPPHTPPKSLHGIRLFVSVLAFRGPGLAFHGHCGARGHEKPERPTVLGKNSFKHKFCLKKLSLRLPLTTDQNGGMKSQPRIDIYLQYLIEVEKIKNLCKIIKNVRKSWE